MSNLKSVCLPLQTGNSVKLTPPRLLHALYLDNSKKFEKKRVWPCPIKKLPVLQEELLNKHLARYLDKEYDRYDNEFRRFIFSGDSLFTSKDWVNWIQLLELRCSKINTPFKHLIGADVLTDWSTWKIFIMDPTKEYLKPKDNQYVTIVCQRIGGVYFIYRVVNAGWKKKYTSKEHFRALYAQRMFDCAVTTREKAFIRDGPFVPTSWASYGFSLTRNAENRRISCFIPTQAVDKSKFKPVYENRLVGNPMPLTINFSHLQWTFDNMAKPLELYLKFLTMGATHFVQGLRTKDHVLAEIKKYSVDALADRLKKLFPNYDWKTGLAFAWSYLEKVEEVLAEYPDGYIAMTTNHVLNKEWNIEVFEPTDEEMPFDWHKLIEEFKNL